MERTTLRKILFLLSYFCVLQLNRIIFISTIIMFIYNKNFEVNSSKYFITYSQLRHDVSYTECLTISSDEEEEGKIKRSDGSSNNIFSNDASNNFSEEMETILEKEPVITNNSISSMSSDYAMESEDIKGILQYASYFTYFTYVYDFYKIR